MSPYRRHPTMLVRCAAVSCAPAQKPSSAAWIGGGRFSGLDKGYFSVGTGITRVNDVTLWREEDPRFVTNLQRDGGRGTGTLKMRPRRTIRPSCDVSCRG